MRARNWVFSSIIFVSKFAKDLQPCKLDAIAATATFAMGANLVQIYHFALCPWPQAEEGFWDRGIENICLCACMDRPKRSITYLVFDQENYTCGLSWDVFTVIYFSCYPCFIKMNAKPSRIGFMTQNFDMHCSLVISSIESDITKHMDSKRWVVNTIRMSFHSF